MKGSETTPLDSSKLRVEMLLKALLVEHKCEHTNNTKHVYDMSNVKQCKIYRERVERLWIKRKHRDMFWGSSHYSTSSPSHRRISTIHYRIFHTGTSTEELQLNIGVQLLLSTQSPLHKREHKVKKEIHLVITKIINTPGDPTRSQTVFLTIQKS